MMVNSITNKSNSTFSPNVDDLAYDIATSLELSERDRAIIENRYRKLKEHLERPESLIAPYLVTGESRIYPQGSIATGTTIISGTDEDRFDLDALVEMNTPADWDEKKTMDALEESLQGFSDVVKIVRCTRCVQLQFAFMHMDVTIMVPETGDRTPRAGKIIHNPEKGASALVPANPYGFSQWFRDSVGPGSVHLSEALAKRRQINGINRIYNSKEIKAAEQDNLPQVLPPHLDTEQVVALKLLKRFVNLRYENRNVRKPPSIYLAKKAVDVGPSIYGLFAQLETLALYIHNDLANHIKARTCPDERNPSFKDDRLNDRWPAEISDMHLFVEDLNYLVSEINRVKTADFLQIKKIFAEIFGEKITGHAADMLVKRVTQTTKEQSAGKYVRDVGTFVPSSAVLSPAVAQATSNVQPHNFHCTVIGDDDQT